MEKWNPSLALKIFENERSSLGLWRFELKDFVESEVNTRSIGASKRSILNYFESCQTTHPGVQCR